MSSERVSSTGQGREREVARREEEPETVPLWLEVGVVGGLGFVVYFGPTLYQLAKDSVTALWPRVEGPVRSLLQKVKQRWEPLNRRRKNGSLIRVVADILPDCCFGPTPRIYIAGVYPSVEVRREFMTFGSGNSRLTGFGTREPSQAERGSGDGMIVAFELDAESECTELDVDDIEIDVSSNPEGWDQNMSTIPLFQPGANGTRFKCSTPTSGVLDCYQRSVLNDSCSTEGTEFDDNGKTQEEIANLKNIIQDLVKQMSVLNENITMRQSQQADSLMSFVKSPVAFDLPPPPANMLLPTFAEVVGGKSSAGPPPPPPPPPPPMPQSLFQGSVPLKINKTKNVETKSAPQAPSMMDVLKDLNKVKLRSAVQRSPGGTPVKAKVNDRNSLEYALKKRFESMHSPPGSDDETADKENEFDDSLLKQKNSPRHCLGKRAKRKSNSSMKSRTPLFEKKTSNEVPPFGPHLLKKRNGN